MFCAFKLLATWRMTTWGIFDLRCPKRRSSAWYLRDLFSVRATAGVTQHYTTQQHSDTEQRGTERRVKATWPRFPTKATRPSSHPTAKGHWRSFHLNALSCKCSRALKFHRRPQRHAHLLLNAEFCVIFKITPNHRQFIKITN